MCGRYALAFSNEEVYDALENQLPRMFERARPRWEREQDYRGGNFNVAPRQRMPIIHRDPEDGEQAMLHTAQWGLIPHWTKHPPTAPLNTINARSESLLEAGSGGMWHALKGYRRCVIPAQGYYEWQKKSSTKIPHFTRLPDHSKSASQPTSSSTTSAATFPLIFFAGLYDIVKYASPVESRFKPSSDPSDKREPYPTGNPLPLCTYTILTTSPPAEFAWLHDRMPCVLNGWEEVRAWLDLGEEEGGWVEGKEGTGRLLRGRSGLECYPVPPEVGKVGTNSPTFIQPVSERADGIKSFFQKQTGASPAKKSIIPKSEIKDDKAGTTRGVKRERSADTKSDIKEEGQDRKRRRSSSSIIEGKREGEEEEIKTVIKDEEGKEDPEPGLGVDSNAPAPKDEKGNEKDKEETPKRKRGGHEIKVTRKPEEVKSDQSSITSFFASPAKPEKSTTSSAPRGAASSKEGGAKRKTRSSR